MTTNHSKKSLSKIFLLLLGVIFVFQTTLAAKPLLDKKNPEYYLKGTLEETSAFNYNLSAGEKITDNITLVNNSLTDSFTYLLQGVDSEINNQQIIVFKGQTADSTNIGKWLSFDKNTVTVGPESSLTIPFTIQTPANAYPGTYYGGISIQKQDLTEKPELTQSFVVKTQTRQVLGLTVNLAGSLDKSYKMSPLIYDQKTQNYLFTIENTGNVILSFEGDLKVNSNNYLGTTDTTSQVHTFRILPQTSVTKTIHFPSAPIFGSNSAELLGELQYFNGINNSNEPLDNISLTVTTTFFSWAIVGLAMGIILLLVLILILTIAREKLYLRDCVKYTVQKDDTVESVAKKYNMSWKKLVGINKLSAPYTLTPDQKILVHESNRKTK